MYSSIPSKYLGRLLAATNDGCLVVIANLLKTRKNWSFLSQVSGREGADNWMSGRFYFAVLQSILFFRL